MEHYWLPAAEQTDGSKQPYICEMKWNLTLTFWTRITGTPDNFDKVSHGLVTEEIHYDVRVRCIHTLSEGRSEAWVQELLDIRASR